MATILTTSVSATPESKRKRRKNFSIEEETVIQTMFAENSSILTQKFSTDVTNKAKAATWQRITDAVNTKAVCYRTVDQVKEKWGNMAQKAKRTYTDYRIQQKKTGGGPAPQEINVTTANIIESMKDTASFSGVPGGIDTPIILSESVINDTIDSGEDVFCPSNPCRPTSSVEDKAQIPVEHHEEPIEGARSAGTSYTYSKESSSKAKRPRHSQEDVLNMQYQVLMGQRDNQSLEKNKLQLENQRLKLQINLLQRLLDQNELDTNLNATQLFMSLLN